MVRPGLVKPVRPGLVEPVGPGLVEHRRRHVVHGPTPDRPGPAGGGLTVTYRLRHDPLPRPGRVLLVLPRGLADAVQVRRTEHRAAAGPGAAVEGLPDAAAPHEQAAGDQVLSAREEDPLDASLRLLQPWAGARAGHDDAVA